MSKFVVVETQLVDIALIKGALDDLRFAYREDARYRHVWSGFFGKVPLLVREEGATFGLRPNGEGVFEVLGDDMQMAAIRRKVEQIQQRYAYRKVLAETEKAGFDLVEEKVDQNNVIRLTVRRWR